MTDSWPNDPGLDTPDASEQEGRAPRGEATDTAYRGLYRLAHHLGPNAKLPPVRQLREQLGVSRTTLDSAMDRLERQRVLVRRERSGVYVAHRLRERSVCLLCAPHYFFWNGVSPFWSLMIEHIRRLARESEVRLNISFTDALAPNPNAQPDDKWEDASLLPEWLVADIEAGKVHGVLTVGLPHSLARWIEAHKVPVVAFAGAAHYIVGTSSTALVQMGVAALAERGCRRISFWRLPDNGSQDQFNHYITDIFAGALAAHGLTLEENGVILQRAEPQKGPRPDPSHVEVGWEDAVRCFGPGADKSRPIDGILSSDDMITQGGLMALHRFGVQLGKDVQVATHANKGSSALLGWQDQLFRIEYDPGEMVRVMFEILDALMDGAAEAGRRFDFEPAEGEGAAAPPERYRLIRPRLIPPL